MPNKPKAKISPKMGFTEPDEFETRPPTQAEIDNVKKNLKEAVERNDEK